MNSTDEGSYAAGPVQLKGRLRLVFESLEFTPHGLEDGWWYALIPKVEREILEQYGEPAEVVFGWRSTRNEVEVEGELSPIGHYAT